MSHQSFLQSPRIPRVSEKLHRHEPPKADLKFDWDWDKVKHVKIEGAKVIRHLLRLYGKHVGIMTPSMGSIGRSDVGRTLVVDVYENGNIIDVITSNQKL